MNKLLNAVRKIFGRGEITKLEPRKCNDLKDFLENKDKSEQNARKINMKFKKG